MATVPVLVQSTGAGAFWIWEGHADKPEIVDRHQGPPMPMINPPHPGQIIRRECLEPLKLTVSRAAEGLGVSRQTLPGPVNGWSGVSVEMAIRLSRGFGSAPESWLGRQAIHELSDARPKRIDVGRFAATGAG